ncbi:hypothetical protein D3C86_1986960 [compost metagenome]
MLLPGTFGKGWSNTTVTLLAGRSAADAVVIDSTAKAAAIRIRLNIAFLLPVYVQLCSRVR